MGSGLAEEVIEFDRQNMRPIFEKAGIEFPEEKRRRGLESDPTFIMAFDGRAVAGYLEYLRSWNDHDYIYVGSVQIEKRYRGARLILMLFDEFRARVAGEDFLGFETNVLKANTAAVRMYQKIGFRLEENPGNEASWLARAGKEILTDSPVAELIDEWRERHARRGAA
jgi:ribosomal protein S18 acetylase RimI-like enzyme